MDDVKAFHRINDDILIIMDLYVHLVVRWMAVFLLEQTEQR